MSDENKEKKTNRTKKVFRILIDVLMGLFIASAAFVLIISVVSKKDSDGTATVFNTQLRFVKSDSMAKCDQTDVSKYKIKSIPVKSCVFINVIPKDEVKKEEWLSKIKIGDVLTFKYVYTKQETITHRVVSIEDKDGGGYIITLEGDNKSSEQGVLQQVIDTSLEDSPNYIIGKVTGQSYFLGILVYTLRSTWGIIFIIIVPCAIIVIANVIRIIRVLSLEKKEKTLVQVQTQNQEIEELKRQLELLQKEKPVEQKEEE